MIAESESLWELPSEVNDQHPDPSETETEIMIIRERGVQVIDRRTESEPELEDD